MIKAKHTNAIARIINEHRNRWARSHSMRSTLTSGDPVRALKDVAEDIAFHCEEDNHRFDMTAFLTKCGFAPGQMYDVIPVSAEAIAQESEDHP